MAKRTVVLIVALVLAGAASFAIWSFLRGVETEAQADFDLVTVYRATQSIEAGTPGSVVISGQFFTESQEHRKYLPGPDPSATLAFTDQASLIARLQDRIAAGPIAPNQILTSDQWLEPVETQVKRLSELLPVGKQAVSVLVDQTRGVGGFVVPGDTVNVVVTIRAPRIDSEVLGSTDLTDQSLRDVLAQLSAATDSEFTRFLLQGVPVLAVGSVVDTETGPSAYAVDAFVNATPAAAGEDGEAAASLGNTGIFTLEVTADEAERLVFASERGSLWITLVPDDFVPVPTAGISRENLFG